MRTREFLTKFKLYAEELSDYLGTETIVARGTQYFTDLLNLTANKKLLNSDDIESFLTVLTTSLEGPGLTGLLRVKEQLRHILEAANAQLGCGDKLNSFSKEIFDDFFTELSRLDKVNGEFNKIVKKEKTKFPLFTFHKAGIDTKGHLSEGYKKNCLRIHRSLKKVKTEIKIVYKEPQKGQEAFYKFCHSARLIIEYPHPYEPSMELSYDENITKYAETVVQYYSMRKSVKLTTLKHHQKKIEQILKAAYSVYSINKTGGYTKRKKEDDGQVKNHPLEPRRYRILIGDNPYGTEGLSLGLTSDIEAASVFEEVPPDILEEALDAGESPDDYADHTMVWQEESLTGFEPHREIKMSYLLAWDSFPFFWDGRYMQFNHYKLLMDYIDDIRHKNDITIKAGALFYKLLIVTGQDPQRLAETRIITKEDLKSLEAKVEAAEDENYLSDYLGRLYFCRDEYQLVYIFRAEDIGWYRNNVAFHGCIRTSRIVRISLLSDFWLDIGTYWNERSTRLPETCEEDREFLFIGFDFEDNTYKALNVTFFKERLFDFNRENDLKITPELVSRSFFPFFTGRYGLDPVIASYISGIVRRQERAQVFYTCISEEKVWKNHADAFEKFNTERRGWEIESDRPMYLESAERSYGSRCVPHTAHLQIFFKKMYGQLTAAEFKGIHGLRSYHNLYTTYTYLALQFATGLRPLRDPGLNALNIMGDYLHIHDKSRRIASESRVLPLPETILYLLREIQEGNNRVIQQLQSMASFDYEKYLELDRPLFFFINEDNTPEPVSPKRLSAVLDRYPGIGNLYTFPSNAPRHYLRTKLFKKDVSRDLVDSIIGHHSSGREFLNIVSTKRLSDLKALALPYIQEILDEIGINQTGYRAS